MQYIVMMYVLGRIGAPWWLVGIYSMTVAFKLFIGLIDEGSKQDEGK